MHVQTEAFLFGCHGWHRTEVTMSSSKTTPICLKPRKAALGPSRPAAAPPPDCAGILQQVLAANAAGDARDGNAAMPSGNVLRVDSFIGTTFLDKLSGISIVEFLDSEN